MDSQNYHTPTIGLALSGGSTRGAAHIGVLQALEDTRIQPGVISGTSVGALIAALYAFDVPVSEIRLLAGEMTPLNISKVSLSKLGLLSNEKLARIINSKLGEVRIEQAKIPLAIIAADINTGEKVVLRSGDVGRAVMASTCLPGIFKPVELDGHLLVDGGLVEDVPISPLRSMGARVVVAVNLGAERKYKPTDDIVDILINTYDILIDQNVVHQVNDADVLIEPKLAAFGRTDTSQIPTLITEGYRATLQKMDVLRTAISQYGELPKPSFWEKIKAWLR